MRLLRTDSFDSLAGIPQRGQWHGLPLIRPLLSCRRADLRDYLKALGQDWIEDPSNEDTRFERVRLRRLMPALEESGLTVDRLASLAQSCGTSAMPSARAAAAGAGAPAAGARPVPHPRSGVWPPPLALRVRILGTVIAHFGGSAAPERAELERLVQAMAAVTCRGGRSAAPWPGGGKRRSHRPRAGAHRSASGRGAAGGPDRLGPALSGHGAARLDSFSAAVSGVPRPSRDVPAVVFGAQPVVKLPDGSLVLAPRGRRAA